MSDLFGGSSQTVKTKADLPPITKAIQSLASRMDLMHLAKTGGVDTFGRWRDWGPVPWDIPMPTTDEQKYLGLTPALLGQTAGLSPWLIAWLVGGTPGIASLARRAGGTVPGAVGGLDLSGGGGSGITSGGLGGFGTSGI